MYVCIIYTKHYTKHYRTTYNQYHTIRIFNIRHWQRRHIIVRSICYTREHVHRNITYIMWRLLSLLNWLLICFYQKKCLIIRAVCFQNGVNLILRISLKLIYKYYCTFCIDTRKVILNNSRYVENERLAYSLLHKDSAISFINILVEYLQHNATEVWRWKINMYK